jgi:hypothetical protein
MTAAMASPIPIPHILSYPLVLLFVSLAKVDGAQAYSDWNNQSAYWLEDFDFEDTPAKTKPPSSNADEDKDTDLSLATLIVIVAAAAVFFALCGCPFLPWLLQQFRMAVARRQMQQDPTGWLFDDLPEDLEDRRGVKTVCQEHKCEVCHDCGCDYTLLNQLCYHYQYVMTEERRDDRLALTKCFMAVHYRNVPPGKEPNDGLTTPAPMQTAKRLLRKRSVVIQYTQYSILYYCSVLLVATVASTVYLTF